MAVYFAVLQEAPIQNSDALVGTKPTGTSEVLSRIRAARFVKVEAASVADAQAAVQQAYGIVQTPIIVTEAQWKES